MEPFLSIDLLDTSKFFRYEKRYIDPDDECEGETIDSFYGLELKEGYCNCNINMDMNCFQREQTKVPEGYNKIKCPDWIIKKYIDPTKTALSMNNDFIKEIRNANPNAKTFLTHDNGARPFLVYYSPNKVSVYSHPSNDFFVLNDNCRKEEMYIELKGMWENPTSVFIGPSPLNEMTEFSGGHGDLFYGNSVLLETSEKGTFVFIGECIYEFKSNDKIETFYSPVGNNDVPYPFAIGKNNVYFMIDKDYVSREIYDSIVPKDSTDAYHYYYGHNCPMLSPKHPMENVKIIANRITY